MLVELLDPGEEPAILLLAQELLDSGLTWTCLHHSVLTFADIPRVKGGTL